jgi:hypothetical protein
VKPLLAMGAIGVSTSTTLPHSSNQFLWREVAPLAPIKAVFRLVGAFVIDWGCLKFGHSRRSVIGGVRRLQMGLLPFANRRRRMALLTVGE